MDETAAPTLNKLPAVTFAFWVMKIAATTLGETAGDLLSMTLNVGYLLSTIILLSAFAAALTAQLAARRFHPFLFWAVILATSTAGTTMSDFMNRTLGLGYATGSAILITALVLVLITWRLCEKSISVSSVRSRRAEVFYWSAILVSNTLGTSLGDYLADDSGLGFAGGALLIGVLIAFLAALYFARRAVKRESPAFNVAIFWAAFVLTRPFGATMGDFLTKPVDAGGLGFGTIGASLALGVILVAAILLTYRRSGSSDPALAPDSARESGPHANTRC